MKISTNTLQYYRQQYNLCPDFIPDGVNELAKKIGAQLGAVEEITHLGEQFDGAVIVRVISCEDHPNADRLHVCKIDDNGAVKNIERDPDGYVQVVCGAPNVRAGLHAAWLPPGAIVPSTFEDDRFVLEARPLRGVMSYGMLASPKELNIGDSHDGILEIEENITPGTAFADAFMLKNDAIIDIENKMFTHRPDCFGWLGVARELAGIQQLPFTSPDWYVADPVFPDVTTAQLPLTVANEIPELVPRFTAVVLSDITIKPSPVWLQTQLSRVGIRPINNIVDYTNYYMLLTGQPIHAYDYDKVMAHDNASSQATLVIRHAKPGEKLTLLNGKVIEPTQNDMMVASAQSLLCLGGAMGGADTEVDTATTRIILEAATWDMYAIRRTSMIHGVFTDAVTRFNKGQSPLQNKAVITQITKDLCRETGAKVASALVDINTSKAAHRMVSLHTPVVVNTDFVNARLGLELSAEEMASLLQNVEFAVGNDGPELTVSAPFWRTDIAEPEDIVEEIGRLYGFDKLPLTLPVRTIAPAPKNPMLSLKERLSQLFAQAGANEVLTYSFVHGDLLDKVGQQRSDAYQLSNALSPDLQYYRVSLMPSLLEKIHSNVKASYDAFALFEMNATHNLLHTPKQGEAPAEYPMLGFVYTDAKQTSGTAYYHAKAYLDHMASELGLSLVYAPVDELGSFPVAQPYEARRSALVQLDSGESLGIIGEFKMPVLKKLKAPLFTAGFEVSLDVLMAHASHRTYRRLPKFPVMDQDVCFKVTNNVTYARVVAAINESSASSVVTKLQPIDIYKPDETHRHITIRLTLQNDEKTLTTSEANSIMDSIVADVAAATGAVRV